MAPGRREEADALFAQLRDRDPDDVWLYNAAAYSYAVVDPRVSLEWALGGIDVAFETGDPDQVVMQLLECAEEAWDSLDLPVDRVEAFCEHWTPPAGRRHRFPADQWPEAVERWPDLLDDLPADHGDYSHATEARIKRISRHMHGNRLHVTAMTVDGLVAHAAASDVDPGSGEARSSYAATLLQQDHGIAWPPGRNDRCWCGSDRKHKKCCGPVPAEPDDPQ